MQVLQFESQYFKQTESRIMYPCLHFVGVIIGNHTSEL